MSKLETREPPRPKVAINTPAKIELLRSVGPMYHSSFIRIQILSTAELSTAFTTALVVRSKSRFEKWKPSRFLIFLSLANVLLEETKKLPFIYFIRITVGFLGNYWELCES